MEINADGLEKQRVRRQEDYQQAKQQTEIAERELKNLKGVYQNQRDITDRLDNIRSALGLQSIKQNNIQQLSLMATPQHQSPQNDTTNNNYKCEFDNTFGKNDSININQNVKDCLEDELSLRNVENELSKLQSRLLQEISNKKLNFSGKENITIKTQPNSDDQTQQKQVNYLSQQNIKKCIIAPATQYYQPNQDDNNSEQQPSCQNDILQLTSIKKNDQWISKSGQKQQNDNNSSQIFQANQLETNNYSISKSRDQCNQLISTNSLAQLFQKDQESNIQGQQYRHKPENKKDSSFHNNVIEQNQEQEQERKNVFSQNTPDLFNRFNKSNHDDEANNTYKTYSAYLQQQQIQLDQLQLQQQNQQDDNEQDVLSTNNLNSIKKQIINIEEKTCDLIETNQQQDQLHCQELKDQIQQLEKVISNLSFELQSRSISERYLKHQLTNLQNQQYFKDEENKNEKLLLESQIKQLQASRELLRNGGNIELKNYILQLETDLYLTKSQLNNAAKEKSRADAHIEDLQKQLNGLASKIEKELDKKYQSELRDLKYIIENLKNENDQIFRQQNSQSNQSLCQAQCNQLSQCRAQSKKRGTKKACSSCTKYDDNSTKNYVQTRTTTSITMSSLASINNNQLQRKTRNQTMVGIRNCQQESSDDHACGVSAEQMKSYKRDRESEVQSRILQKYQEQINQLNEEKYQLEEKVEWLELQQRTGGLDSKYFQDKGQELLIFEKRYKSLREQARFWKDKAQRLSNHFYKVINDLKNENQLFKNQFINNQKSFFIQCEKLIKDMVALSQQENCDLRNELINYAERINTDQSKIAQLRYKIKKLQEFDEKENNEKNVQKEEKRGSQTPNKFSEKGIKKAKRESKKYKNNQ